MVFNNQTTLKQVSKSQRKIGYWVPVCRQAGLGIGHYKRGFTLVELIVSVAITGILMLGISAFFSSTFQNLFNTQTQTTNTEKQYAVNEIIRNKFLNLEKILNDFSDMEPPKALELLYKNKSSENILPFSYIGKNEMDKNEDGTYETYLAFKDMMIFNKVDSSEGADFYGDSGSGLIKKASDGGERNPNLDPDTFKNFAGFTYCKNKYFVVLPDKNKIMECDFTQPCSELSMTTQLLSPTDITCDNDGKYLYISDSGNNRVIEYEIGVGEKLIPIATGLNYPTGLAFYYDGTTSWLFVADTLNNKIRKYNLSNRATIAVTVIGDGEDTECANTAKFCKLNMPTGIFADDNKQELFIADSGNNRILKMKDPTNIGEPALLDPNTLDELSFEFSLDDNYALDRIEFENNSWDGNGTYDETVSNLIGKSTNFNNKVFKNPDRLTTYVGATKCQSAPKLFYVNEETSEILKDGDKIIIDSKVLTVDGVPAETECKELDEDPSLKKWLINIDESETIADGQTVFFSNPNNVIVKITGSPNITFDKGGFQTFTIKTYDLTKGLVETDYSPIRVGDGKLGTDEDIIEVIVDSGDYFPISFPTGVTNQYFANTGATENNAKIVYFSPTSPKSDLNPIATNAFDIFDYISDFILADEKPIEFTMYNNEKLLELVIKALVDESRVQTYKLNAVIPK